MNDRITAGAMVLTVDLAAAARLARWWVTAPARHRAPRPLVRAVLDEVTLEQLLPPWPPVHEPDPPRTWQWCPDCIRREPGVLYPDGWWCGNCKQPSPAEDTATTIGGTRP